MEVLNYDIEQARKGKAPFLIITNFNHERRSIKGKLVSFSREGLAKQREDAKKMIQSLREEGYEIPSLWHDILFADKPLDHRTYRLFSRGLLSASSMTDDELDYMASIMQAYETNHPSVSFA